MHCTICTICTMEGKVQKVQKVQGKKNDSANFYIGGNNRERIFYLSKITKNDSKILLSFTKDAKEIKVYVCNFLYKRHGMPGNGRRMKKTRH